MRQVIVKLKHPVAKVRRDAVAALRRHDDGVGLEATETVESTAEARMIERLTSALERLVAQCQSWNRSLDSQLRESQTLAVEVGIAVAEKLLHDEIRHARHDVQKLVAAALTAAGSRKPTLVRLSAADEQRLKASGAAVNRGEDAVQIAADPDLADGNVELELPGFRLVFDWRHELETIKRNIMNDLSHAER